MKQRITFFFLSFITLLISCQEKKSEKEKKLDFNVFQQGALEFDEMVMGHEKPAHPSAVDGFFMDKTEVTNTQFQKFVNESGYITIAERAIEWKELKQQLPAGTLKLHNSILKPGSVIFRRPDKKVSNLFDYSQWWQWKIGTNWKRPHGPDNTLNGKGDLPVGFYPPNPFGLYEMAGNVWEWTQDWYRSGFYQDALKMSLIHDPEGAEKPYNRNNPLAIEKVIKGGSFLCNASYCASFRISSRMANSLDSDQEHLEFRTVATVKMIRTNR